MSNLQNANKIPPAHFSWGEVTELIPALRRYAWALLRRDHCAESDDLVQECLTRAWEKRHQFTAGSNLRAWLFTILHNNYATSVRRAVSRQKNERLMMPTLDQGNHAAAAEQQLELQSLQAAMDRLPEGQRAVVLLVAVEGMSYKDVARVTKTPLGTVRSRLSRAREALDHSTQRSH